MGNNYRWFTSGIEMQNMWGKITISCDNGKTKFEDKVKRWVNGLK